MPKNSGQKPRSAKNQLARSAPKPSKKGAPIRALKAVTRKSKERLRHHRKSSPHRSFLLTRRSEIPRYEKIPAWWRILYRSLLLLKNEWKKYLLLVAIFTPLAWLVSGVYNQNFATIKQALGLLGEGEQVLGLLEQSLVLFGGFVTAQTSSIPQDALVTLNFIGVLLWLSFVWIARYHYAHKPTTLREALYTSGAALVPFILLLMLLVVQLLPATVAGVVFGGMSGTGFTQTPLEIALFVLLGLMLIVLSLYFIVSTIIALQVVALPGMYPWRALRNARKLVAGRRFSVLRKLAMILVVIFVVWALVFTPVLLLDNAICPAQSGACWSTFTLVPLVYYSLVGLTLVFASTYLYVLYRALLEQEDDYV